MSRQYESVQWQYEIVYIKRNKLSVKVFNYYKKYDLYPLDLPEDVVKFTAKLNANKKEWWAYLLHLKDPYMSYVSHRSDTNPKFKRNSRKGIIE